MNVTNADVMRIPIASIVIGVRRRSSLGRLVSLQRSIAENGLIHPILVRNGNELVAGARRLEACKRLGWKQIPARRIDRMSDEALRAIEVHENQEREALNTFDTSKARLAEIRQAEADLKTKADRDQELLREPRKNSRRGRKGEGRPKKQDSKGAVAEALGTTRRSVERTEQHVALAEQYPFLQRPGWVQHSVLEAGSAIERVPEKDRPKVAALLDQEAIPPKKAIAIIEHLADMDRAERQSIFDQARSDDAFERTTALTRAAHVPPPVDPGLTLLADGRDALVRAAKTCRSQTFKPRMEALAKMATDLYAAFREDDANARRHDRTAEARAV
jgi:ParB-like chromosome segregation protein Spo0J